MTLNVRKCCQGHAQERRVSRGTTLRQVGLGAIGAASLPSASSSRFGFGIYFTLQGAAHFFCYDGAVLGTILRGVIAPLCGYCLGYLICFFLAFCGIVARLSAGASGRTVGVSGGGSAVSGALSLGASAGVRVGVWGGCREVGRGRWANGWGVCGLADLRGKVRVRLSMWDGWRVRFAF
jgi:hypothetical protein